MAEQNDNEPDDPMADDELIAIEDPLAEADDNEDDALEDEADDEDDLPLV